MAVLWWTLLLLVVACFNAQQILHASQDFQSSPWTTTAKEWTPTPTPLSNSSSLLSTPFLLSTVSSLPIFTPSPPTSSSLPSTSSPVSPSISTPSLPFSSVPPSPDTDKTDEEGSRAALNFLHSGDLSLLSEANCSRRFELTDLQGPPPESLLFQVRGPQDSLLHATNFLNMIFQASDMRESSIREDMEWYHALVRSLAGGDQHIRRALLSITAHPMSTKPQLLLQATKKGSEILLQDLSQFYHARYGVDWGSWHNFQANPSLTKAILLNDLRSLDTPKWSRGDSYIVDPGHVRWSKPFLECDDGQFVQGWMVSLSTAFYGLKPDLSPEFKGALRVDVRLSNLGIDQCSREPGWFANTHMCDENSTQCVSDEKDGSILGRYRCVCQPGYYRTRHEGSVHSYPEATDCQRCSEGCATCVDGSPCLVQEDWALRVTVLSLQAAGMLGVFLSMLVSYNFRDSKRIRASGLLLLETILFGSLLLYFPVFILYFKPSVFRCVALRWVRLLGFCIVYGTIILKLYRVMKIFLSRTAQRVPYMTSVRLLRMLLVILLFCIWFLVGWTLGVLENLQRGVPVVIRTQTREGLIFYTCDHDRWDYMMSLAEFLFLCWGSFLCYGARAVPSAFHEPRYMGLATHNEMLVSAAFHVLRFLVVPSLHPDWTLLLFFIHTHGTVTMTLTLLFVPKFLHAGGPPREEIAAEVYEDELDLRRSRSNLNSSITSAWSEHSLDPDDIRDELKKLYAQLEVHKTKKMTLNNPHLQKKRSSRRGLGRSIIRRITEAPDSGARQSAREEREGSPGSSGSQRRRQQDGGSVKLREESLRQRVLSLRKSHSTYDHMQETKDAGAASPRLESSARDASLRDSLMRRNLARNVSLRSRGDSLRQAPLVCKSLSAHNLLADKKPLSVRPGALQKSQSVMGSARGKGPLVGFAETTGERTIEGSRNPLLGGSFDKAEVCPWELQELPSSFDRAEVCPWELQELPTPSESRSQKHVTYAPGKCSSLDSSHDSGKPHVSQGRKGEIGGKHQSLGNGEENGSPGKGLQKCMNAQGSNQKQPGDPNSIKVRPGKAAACSLDSGGQGTKVLGSGHIGIAGKDPEPAESLRPIPRSTLKSLVLAVKAFKGTAAGRREKERSKQGGAGGSMKQKREEVCPWETESSTCESKKQQPSSLDLKEKRQIFTSPKQEGNLELHKSKEKLASPTKVAKDTPSASRLERMSQLREVVCPWESMEGPHGTPQKSKSVESRRSEICPWESTDSDGPGGPLSQSESNMSFHIPSNERERDQNGGVWESEERSLRVTICPWEQAESGGLKGRTLKEQICPWEAEKEEDMVVGSLSGKSLAMKLEELGRKRDAVCPWESEESGGSPGPLSQSVSKTFNLGPIQSKTSDSLDLVVQRGEICPWESLDSEGTPATLSQSQSHSWEPVNKAMEEPSHTSKAHQGRLYKSQSKQDSLCSWSSEEPQPLSKVMSKSESRMGDLYSSVIPKQHGRRCHHSLREQNRGDIGELRLSILQQQGQMPHNLPSTGDEDTRRLAEICPWEVQEKPAETQATTSNAHVCPWDFQ
ncbi:putative G-protein coupled receptor 179 [Rhinophrynus dorsalis]